MNTARMGVGIVSAGKVGAAIGSALRAAGHSIIGAYATSEASLDRLENMLPGVPALDVQTIVERSQLVVLAVPDRELIPLVKGLTKLGAWQSGQIVMHTAGRYGADILAGAAAAGALTLAVHPAMTFTGTSLDVARLQGCPFSVSASPMLQPIGLALVAEMGGEGVVIADVDRPLYHAALAHGANHLVTVVAQAERVLEQIGIADAGAYLRPLTQAALEGALSSGEALQTGPVVRGDAVTVEGHVEQLDELAADVPELADVAHTYRALARATITRALARGVISQTQAGQMTKIVEEA
ncbi:putative short-subunit dehydrogenase-like oxidoreductase (DUF2520 family) [Arcanobacterium wilhelmae]|uniref:Short-subunit dehydrogenase-like oxidoreductase (DUF2520 family) n=1 Tax=Arcanobacterium wilhelmae TaxID=1803177 RepID=A0ABT9NA62_9ACTO|nr:Rossmann-like and DUF2520 domain-containing protein [Arcanobacterium wilhelmae]MDP9800607.1 putative short-subunit dehydrogenase-like oxidoreductase (DUF2520 family) [Arcanobacterium wilhelmae]WFN90015.1 DUF2520 domain-containing protein [Arcanobacterium wilhelmae]